MSWYSASTAATRDISRYSLYMLWVPERESYLIQIPKFLTFWGFFSWIWRLSVSRPPCPLSVCTHLVYGDDLTVGLLDLAELAKEVPEP
jgi:hypothetical protein